MNAPVTRPRPRRSPLRGGVRFVASVLITSGVLLIADAGLTLAWQEPVSAVVARLEQGRLEEQLDAAAARLARERRLLGLEARGRLAALAALYERRTREGEALGRIRLPSLARSYVVIEGTSVGDLRKGPGHYPRTPLPGQRGTVAIAGHRTTYLAPFRTLDKLQRGDPIVVEMPYGRFTYHLERTRVVEPTATEVTRRVAHDRLVLTACHPLYSAEQRIVVFARLASAVPAGLV